MLFGVKGRGGGGGGGVRGEGCWGEEGQLWEEHEVGWMHSKNQFAV